MRCLTRFLLALAFVIATSAGAQTAEEQERLDWAQQRGTLLYEIDRAAWVTTDDLRQRLPDLAASGIRGWTVERDGAAYNVTYYAGEGDARVAAYRARVESNRVVAAELIPVDARPPLTPLQRRLADARGVVHRTELRLCSNASANVAVIPPERPEADVDLYVLTPQTQNGVFPFGGHNRITLSPAGDIRSQRTFTNTCLNMQQPANAAGLGVTHLLDPLPTEIHVFMAIWIGLPIFVGTSEPQRVWEVTGDHIRLVNDPRAAPRN